LEEGVPIRAVSRGVAVLQAVNRAGSISLMQTSRQTQIPYPTVCRIVQTLLHEGLIEKEPNRKRYRSTALVQSLSSGFQDDSRLVKVARPHIVELTKRVAWPISIATRVGNMMMVRDSTHSLTSLTLSNYAPGYTLPIAECSSGKVYLAYCSDEERESIRSGFRISEHAPDKLGLLHDQRHPPQRLRDAGPQHLHGDAGQDLLHRRADHARGAGHGGNGTHLLRRGHEDAGGGGALRSAPEGNRQGDLRGALRLPLIGSRSLGGSAS
jgi:DNA-binding IclR family transcriptional regulator